MISKGTFLVGTGENKSALRRESTRTWKKAVRIVIKQLRNFIQLAGLWS